jgi:hypothetical protein
MKINKKILTVLAALAILGAATGCNKNKQAEGQTSAEISGAAAGKESYDYSKILKGDFSDFVGTWVSNEYGTIQFRADGTFNESWVANGFKFDKDDNTYKWNIDDSRDGSVMALYPVGVEIKKYDDGKIIQSEKTKVRLGYGYMDPSNYIFYRDTSGKAIAPPTPPERFDYSKLLKGDLYDFRGSYANGAGEKRQIREDGTFADGQTASGFTRQNNPKMASGGDFYMWSINSSEGGGFAVALFPPGVDIMGYEGIIPTDKTRIRLTMGQDLPSSSADVFHVEYADFGWLP